VRKSILLLKSKTVDEVVAKVTNAMSFLHTWQGKETLRKRKILHPPGTYGNNIFVDCENISKNCTTNTNCGNRSCGSDNLFP